MFGAHADLLLHCLGDMLHELHRNLVTLLQGIYFIITHFVVALAE